MLSTTRRY